MIKVSQEKYAELSRKAEEFDALTKYVQDLLNEREETRKEASDYKTYLRFIIDEFNIGNLSEIKSLGFKGNNFYIENGKIYLKGINNEEERSDRTGSK